MPRSNPLQDVLNAGELSPRLHARVDFAKYPAGAAVMQNIIPLVQGGWMRRPSTRYIAETKDSSAKPRLVKFEFNDEQAYTLEFGNNYIRFYRDQGQITAEDVDAVVSNGTFTSNITDWDDLSTGAASIAHDSTNGRLSLVGASGETSKAEQDIATTATGTKHLVRFRMLGIAGDNPRVSIGTTSGGTEIMNAFGFRVGWHVREFTPSASPFYLQFHHSNAKTLQVDDVSIIDNAAVEIGSPWATADLAGLRFAQTADVAYISHPSYPTYRLERHSHVSWSLEEVDWVDGPYLDQNSTSTTLNPGATTGLGVSLAASATTGINDGDGFQSTDVGRLVRLQHSAAADWGYGVIVSVSDTTNVTIDIKRDFAGATAVTAWILGAWSGTTGYPRANTFFEQRLALGGTTEQPQTFWLSQSADVENMRFDSFVSSAIVVEDDDALDFTLSADEVNSILWMVGGTRLVIGTLGGEWIAASSGAVLTPTDITVSRRTTHGSKPNVDPVSVGDSILFLQRAGRKVREFAEIELDLFKAPDMTRLAEHISRGGFTEMAYQQEPESLIWAVRADGVLACLTFQREEVVVGWSRHILGGAFSGGDAVVESVATIPGRDGAGQVQSSEDRDEVWLVVKRTINGATKRYVEMMEGVFEGPLRPDYATEALWEAAMLTAQQDAYFADSILTYDGVATTSITGLDHLEGETVKVLADGAIHPDKTVASGAITLDYSASVVQVGLGYTHTFQSLKLASGAAAGTAVGKKKRVAGVTLVVHDAAATQMGPALDKLKDVTFREVADPMDTAVPLHSGEHYQPFGGEYARDPRFFMSSDNPAPFSLLAIAPEMITNDVR